MPAEVQRHSRNMRDPELFKFVEGGVVGIISQVLLGRELLHARVGHQLFDGRAGNGRKLVGARRNGRRLVGAKVVAQEQPLQLQLFVEHVNTDEIERENEAQLGGDHLEQLVFVADSGDGLVEVEKQGFVLVGHGL